MQLARMQSVAENAWLSKSARKKHLNPFSAELVAQAVQNSKDAPKEAAEAQVNHGRGPRGVMKAWANMSPDAAVRHLQQRAETLKLSSQQGSGPAVASGLRAWHQFAVSFLEYPPDETLPPKRAGDVLKFIAVFFVCRYSKELHRILGLGMQIPRSVAGMAQSGD